MNSRLKGGRKIKINLRLTREKKLVGKKLSWGKNILKIIKYNKKKYLYIFHKILMYLINFLSFHFPHTGKKK